MAAAAVLARIARSLRKLMCCPHLLVCSWFRRQYSSSSFHRLHVLYFFFFSALGCLSLWTSPKPSHLPRLPFLDALFNAVSAITVTGLSTIEMHGFSTFDKVMLLVLMVLGSHVITSVIPLFIRRMMQQEEAAIIADDLEMQVMQSKDRQISGYLINISDTNHNVDVKADPNYNDLHGNPNANPEYDVRNHGNPTNRNDYMHGNPRSARNHGNSGILDVNGSDNEYDPSSMDVGDHAIGGGRSYRRSMGVRRAHSMPMFKRKICLGWDERGIDGGIVMEYQKVDSEGPRMMIPTRRRRQQQQQQLGFNAPAVEREALAVLSRVVMAYFVVAQVVGFLFCEVYFYVDTSAMAAGARATLRARRMDRSFFSLFSTVSSFSNAGFILLDENLVPLQRASPLLLCFSTLILIGNTLFAPTLRLVLWALYHASAGRRRDIYSYLLNSPRRCYTHLFPRNASLWLVLTVAIFNATQMTCMYAFDWSGPAFQGLGTGYKLVDGLFQSVTTRNAGMNVINIAALSASTLVLSLGMMYVAVYPVYITRQRSKEPLRRADGSLSNPEKDMKKQVRMLLTKDTVYLFITTFLICIFERHSMREDPMNFSVFNILFEVISAYGNVGLSLGYSCSLRPPSSTIDTCADVLYSFSGKWSVAGKLLLVVVMLVGRHRWLPDDVDWAISPPMTQSISHSENITHQHA